MSGDSQRPAGRRLLRDLGARPVGPRARRARLRRAAVRVGAARRRVRAAVDRRARRQELVPRDRGAAAEGAGRATMLQRVRAARRARADRLRVGNGDEYDVALAQANVATLRDTARSLDARLPATRCARSRCWSAAIPRRRVAVPAALPRGRATSRSALPSELLERRPDVVAAERRVAAAFYRTEEAKAARLPRITLTAELHVDLERALRAARAATTRCGASAPGLAAADLPRRPAAGAGRERAPPSSKQAIADYGKVGARAFGEVEGALSAGFALAEREAILRDRGARERARARARQRALSRRLRRPARRAAAAARALLGAASRCCACSPSASCSASTCISRSAAASTPRAAVTGASARSSTGRSTNRAHLR